MNDITIHNVAFNHVYADLSYADFFDRYYPHRDGRVYASTGSFDHAQMKFWWRFEPTSTFFISSYKHEYVKKARSFVRRYPLFEVYSVPKLHTKAVFFERSGVLLVGSENIYTPTSTFAEVMLETVVPEEQRQQIVDLIFGRLSGTILTAKFGVEDIRIHVNGSFATGRPFLPCHRETPYWDVIGPPPVLNREPHDPHHPLPQSEPRQFHRWIYHVREYQVADQRCGLAFDRGYTYCGDLDQPALDWLLTNCEIIEQRKGSGPIEQSDSTMVKDRFYRYHPIAKSQQSVNDYWFGPVKNLESFTELHDTIKDE